MEDIQMEWTNETIFEGLDCNREIDYFCLFFDDVLVERIVRDSEDYFVEKFYNKADLSKITPNSYVYMYRKHGFKKSHLFAYIAAILYMGLEPKKQIDQYWSEDPFHSNNFLPKYISRNFFFYLSGLVHFQIDGQADNDRDPRIKIEKFIELLSHNFRNFYYPGEILTIDESLVFFKGRQKMKFYLPSKPHKWGFKLHLLCDSNSDYVYNILFDPGKEFKNLILKADHTFTESVVLKLLEHIGGDHHIFMDSWYSSISLARKLKQRNLDVTTILKANASGVSKKSYDKEDIDSTIKLYQIQDRKTLNFLSSVYDNSVNNPYSKPDIQYYYNKYARSVDYVNQISSLYSLDNKVYKWWKRILYFLLDVVISNAIIIMEERTGSKVENYIFRKKLIQQMFEDYPIREIETIYKKASYIPKEYRNRLHHSKTKRLL